ncbi:MAG TPA: RNase adapter RapZ, partial [Gemmatimonadales bacterium]|nr:RNase adapter RapZ [Gemmatimonadales bacterium]
NLPLPLLRQFLDNPLELAGGTDRIAVVTDVRAPGFAEEFPRLFAEIDRERIEPRLLFLEASDEVLVRRFSETRRPHPLAADLPVIEGIRREREVLAELRARADMVLETSGWSIHEIRSQIYREFASNPGEEPGMVVSLVSFGFKHGIPYGTDLLFDVRFLPNPHFVPGLREQTGQDEGVQSYLDRQPDFGELVGRLSDLLAYLLPRYRRENRSYLSVAIGCTGGRHRSVAVAERLKAALEEQGWPARVIHRDISR